MYKVTDVEFIEYYSDTVPKSLIKNILIGSNCSDKGIITLTLSSGLNLKQDGPYLIPPIRWLESFNDSDEFIIKCTSILPFEKGNKTSLETTPSELKNNDKTSKVPSPTELNNSLLYPFSPPFHSLTPERSLSPLLKG